MFPWLATIVVSLFISACSSVSSPDKARTDFYRAEYDQKSDTFKNKIRQGVVPANFKKQIDTAVARELLDPESRKVTFWPQNQSSPYRGLVCGYVNAKNAFGGYTGDQLFIAAFDSSGALFFLHTSGSTAEDISTETTTAVIIARNCLPSAR